MQTAITIAGGVVGASLGQPQLGLMVGATLGAALYPPEAQGGPTSLGPLGFTAAHTGQVLPIVYGRTRVPGTLIWYSVADSGGGKKGGPGGDDRRMAIALAEGQVGSLLTLWSQGDELDLGALDYTFYEGTGVQTADALITANLAVGQVDCAYPHVCYFVINATTEAYLTFEIARTTADVAAGNPAIAALGLDAYPEDVNGDMNPVVCLADFMTHPRYGLGLAATDLHAASWLEEAGYASYMGLFCSPVLDTAQPGTSHIEHLLSYFDGMLGYSQGTFHLHSRRSPSRENLPYTQIQPWEWLDGYVPKFGRGSERQVANLVTVEYRNRADAYNTAPTERRDDWDIGRRGIYREQLYLNGVTTAVVADRITSKLLWSRITGPKTVEWGMGPAGVWYEPLILVSFEMIGAAAYALEGSIYRIVKITENPDGTFIFAGVEER